MPLTIPTASSAKDLKTRLQAFRQDVVFAAKPIALNEVDRAAREADTAGSNSKLWRSDAVTGNIGRGDGLFFQVQGLELRSKGPTGSMHYFQPIVRETPPAGTVVLVCDKQTGDVLVDMKVETGTDPQRKYTTFKPSLQVSSSRLELAKTNNQDPALPLLSALVGLGVLDARAIEVQQDPGRFLNKRNENRVVFVENKEDVDAGAPASLVWAKLSHLEDDANVHEFNEFLWQSLGLLARERRSQAIEAASA